MDSCVLYVIKIHQLVNVGKVEALVGKYAVYATIDVIGYSAARIEVIRHVLSLPRVKVRKRIFDESRLVRKLFRRRKRVRLLIRLKFPASLFLVGYRPKDANSHKFLLHNILLFFHRLRLAPRIIY